MKAILVCLAITAVGVTALPENYGLFLQQWQQWAQQQPKPMPQWLQQPDQLQWGQEPQPQPMPQPEPQVQSLPNPLEPQMYQYQPIMPEQPQWGQEMQWQEPQPQPMPQVMPQPMPLPQEPPMYQNQQWQQAQPQPQPQPQPQESQTYSQYQQNMSPEGYKIVPGIIDSRCPRTDDPKNPTHLPIRGDCGKFMKCYGGRAYEQLCPAGLEFGIAVNRCDYPALAKCSSGGW